jgi:hypothetical protein
MTDYRDIEAQLRESFDLRRRPVAVAFRETPPAGVAKLAVRGRDLAKLAAEARTIAAANAALTDYHRARRQALATE